MDQCWERSWVWLASRSHRLRVSFPKHSPTRRTSTSPPASPASPAIPKKPFRVVKVTMLEDGKKMLFEPAVVEVQLGEQVRFEIFNEGSWTHEFVLATEAANRKHAELMKKFPDMEHADPNAIRLSPFATGSILWKFTKRGTFEYACLIPGHLEAGMRGAVIVK
jgi:uncharacterized cupredoxin-like copper-binding protein